MGQRYRKMEDQNFVKGRGLEPKVKKSKRFKFEDVVSKLV